MELGHTIIQTPKDDPTKFDPAWRHMIGTAWHSLPRPIGLQSADRLAAAESVIRTHSAGAPVPPRHKCKLRDSKQ